MLENGMAVSMGRLREDTQYDYKFVCLSHNTLRGAAGGGVLMAELLCAEGTFDKVRNDHKMKTLYLPVHPSRLSRLLRMAKSIFRNLPS